jgi:RNA polymerase sigma-70 factor (ECF subfamily)
MNKKRMLIKEQQFRELVEQNKSRIERICRYYAPRNDDWHDIYQEVLVNLWKSLDTFRGEAAISTWIYRVAVNTALGYAGKELQRLRLNVSDDGRHVRQLLQEDQGGAAEKEYRLSEMELALNNLTVIDKLLMSLVLEDLSTREIADIMGITEPNVRVKIHRIKESLRNHFKEESHD